MGVLRHKYSLLSEWSLRLSRGDAHDLDLLALALYLFSLGVSGVVEVECLCHLGKIYKIKHKELNEMQLIYLSRECDRDG